MFQLRRNDISQTFIINAFSFVSMKVLAPVVQDMDSAIHRIYHHPVDQYHESH